VLTPEEVKKQLQHENPKGREDLLSRLHKLPAKVAALGVAFVEGISSRGWDEEDVAHRGGVDLEATASTVDMRAALLRETLRLLRIHNVRLAERYASVDGKLGAYNVHLGSGAVHRQPGGSLCIIPVHSQYRGRLFLPFTGDDPKTAEIVSKVVLLSVCASSSSGSPPHGRPRKRPHPQRRHPYEFIHLQTYEMPK
jgi:hypothetical protein